MSITVDLNYKPNAYYLFWEKMERDTRHTSIYRYVIISYGLQTTLSCDWLMAVRSLHPRKHPSAFPVWCPQILPGPFVLWQSHQRLKVIGAAERLHASSWKDKILNPMTLRTLTHWLEGLELHCVDLGREEWRRRPTASQKTVANMAAWPSHTLQTSWPGRALAYTPGLVVWWLRHRSRFNFAMACRNAAGYLFWGAQLSTPIPQSPTSDTAND